MYSSMSLFEKEVGEEREMGCSVTITTTICLLLARTPQTSTRCLREATNLYSSLSDVFVVDIICMSLVYHKQFLFITNKSPIYNSSSVLGTSGFVSSFGASSFTSSGFSDWNASSTLLRMRNAPFFSFDTLSLLRNFWILAFSESR